MSHGERRLALYQQWLDALQVAIIEEHHDSIHALLQEMPNLSQEEAIEANNLIQATIPLFQEQQFAIKETMQKIKNNSAFLSQEKKRPRLSTLT